MNSLPRGKGTRGQAGRGSNLATVLTSSERESPFLQVGDESEGCFRSLIPQGSDEGLAQNFLPISPFRLGYG